MDVRDKGIAHAGEVRIDWAARDMPVLGSIAERFERDQPLAGLRIAACLHVTAETGVLVRALRAGGAEVRVCASNPLSTQDDVAAALAAVDGIEVFAVQGEDTETYFAHIAAVLAEPPVLTMDDGADLVSALHTGHRNLLAGVKGGTEETTTGVIRLRGMAADGVLAYPVVAVNDACTKHLFDNRHGTGQSTIGAIVRATNRLLAGTRFVVCGYGWCGRGLAQRAAGMGARVTVTETDPIRALEALMDGYEVRPLEEAAASGDIFCTVTGDVRVIGEQHLARMKDGAILCNAGHFDVELDVVALRAMAVGSRRIRESVEEFELADGRRLCLLSEGRLVNLAAAEGAPSSVMDMSFANQALCGEFLARRAGNLAPGVHDVPHAIDRAVAEAKLAALGVAIDTLTVEQAAYGRAWRMGT